jgi:predicted metal-dependent HD superfamily phosphohydrolase
MDSTAQDRLRLHWNLLLGTGVNQPHSSAVYEDLVARYSSPDRHYHNLDHIRNMLAWLAERKPRLEDLPLGLAVWFHDAVYDPRAQDNEEQSALLARTALASLGLADDQITTVTRLILLTRTHLTDPDDQSGALLLDADLAILGADPAVYDAYASAIRREYAWVAEEAYRVGRRRVLEAFLQRRRIYHTAEAFSTGETRARENLRRECAALTAAGEKK